jgi:hypothetical protein
MKPDVSAIDGVSITGAGGFGQTFFGTSAAAPHVAGEAALLLQAAPCFIANSAGAIDPVSARQTLRGFIVGNAAPVAGSTPDNTFGAGRADALLATAKTVPALPRSTTLALAANTSAGASLTATALGFVDPVGCGLTRLSWTGGCGSSPGSALTCPFGTSDVAVRASSNGISFSESARLTITVSDFSVAAAPAAASIRAGQSATYQVTVTPQGGPITSPINLSCGTLPPGATCAFSPAIVIPGAAGAQSTLTITTTSTAAALVPPAREPWASVLAAMALAGALLVARSRRPAPRSSNFNHRTSKVVVAASLLAASCGGGTPPASPPSAAAPAVTLSTGSLNFGAVNLRTPSAPQTVTVTNSGTAALVISGIAANGDFAQTTTCGASLAAGAGCAVQVTFTPAAAGVRAGALTLTDNAANSPQSIALAGSGVASSTPAGTYGVNVTAVSGALVRSSSVTLTVQ